MAGQVGEVGVALRMLRVAIYALVTPILLSIQTAER
jgi:hypothetical protein